MSGTMLEQSDELDTIPNNFELDVYKFFCV